MSKSVRTTFEEAIEIRAAEASDISHILLLQKLAYLSEAEIYNDHSIPPLHETLDEIRAELEKGTILKAMLHDNLVGSVRAYEKDNSCFIGRLIVDHAYQNKGFGKRLMKEIENHFTHVARYELFTGHKSTKNLSLYNKLGYAEFKQLEIHDKLTLVFLEKRN